MTRHLIRESLADCAVGAAVAALILAAYASTLVIQWPAIEMVGW